MMLIKIPSPVRFQVRDQYGHEHVILERTVSSIKSEVGANRGAEAKRYLLNGRQLHKIDENTFELSGAALKLQRL